MLSALTTAALIAIATWEWFSLNGGYQRWLLGRKV